MEFRILQKKLLFLHHLQNLPPSALASEVFAIQTENGLPGIFNECREFLAKFEIYNLKQYSKFQFKNLVKKKIFELNKSKLLELAQNKKYKKVDFSDLAENDFNLKPYFKNLKIADSKLKFKLVSKMVPYIKMNFTSDKRYASESWLCDSCKGTNVEKPKDTQEHVLVCSAYENLRQGKNLSDDKDIVEYFRQVLNHRMLNQ